MATDPISERARLEQQLRAATAAGEDAGRRLGELKAQREALDVERLRAYEALARGEADARKRVDAAERRRTTLLAEIERVTVELEGARQARQNVSTELARLLQDELAVFADEAEEVTAEAIEAFAAMEEPLRKAQAAWREAQAAWQPLLPAVRAVVQRKQQEEGVWAPPPRLDEAATVAGFPLPQAAQLFAAVAGGLAPRPAGLTPTLVEAVLAQRDGEEDERMTTYPLTEEVPG
ncbi:MAG: hypothetical protein M3N47_06965 [Chloroflexota bacterium]|nr:hypothetical protein [Chloroflexota bacterium]